MFCKSSIQYCKGLFKLIAIFDQSENKIVIIGDRLYRLSFEEFSRVKPMLESRGLMYLNGSSKEAPIQPLAVLSSNVPAPISPVQTIETERKEYIASKSGRCVVINGLEPKLQFMGLDDFKTVDSLMNTYGKIPDEINSLLKAGALVMINETEKQDRIAKMKEKQSVKGKRVTQSTSKSVRMAENSGDQDEASYDDSSDDIEERVLRNAVKIDI